MPWNTLLLLKEKIKCLEFDCLVSACTYHLFPSLPLSLPSLFSLSLSCPSVSPSPSPHLPCSLIFSSTVFAPEINAIFQTFLDTIGSLGLAPVCSNSHSEECWSLMDKEWGFGGLEGALGVAAQTMRYVTQSIYFPLLSLLSFSLSFSLSLLPIPLILTHTFSLLLYPSFVNRDSKLTYHSFFEGNFSYSEERAKWLLRGPKGLFQTVDGDSTRYVDFTYVAVFLSPSHSFSLSLFLPSLLSLSLPPSLSLSLYLSFSHSLSLLHSH